MITLPLLIKALILKFGVNEVEEMKILALLLITVTPINRFAFFKLFYGVLQHSQSSHIRML